MKGFTLIELLVVVLIIGILAGVALPQYQKAVLKSKIARGIVLLNAIDKAQKVYYLENGTFGKTEDLSIEAPARSGLGSCQNFGTWGFCQYSVSPEIYLEWNWQYNRDTQYRCYARAPLGEKVCASYNGANCSGPTDNRFCRLIQF